MPKQLHFHAWSWWMGEAVDSEWFWIPVRHLKEYFAHLDLLKNANLTWPLHCWNNMLGTPWIYTGGLEWSYLCQTPILVLLLPLSLRAFSCLVPKVNLYPVLRLNWNVTSPQNFPDLSPSPAPLNQEPLDISTTSLTLCEEDTYCPLTAEDSKS